MKRTLLFIACVLVSLAMPAQDELTVEDKQNSGCLAKTRGEESEPIPTIILTKEGSVLAVQLLNYESNCGTIDFNVTSTVNGGSDGEPYSVNISVVPRLPDGELPACLCPYNVSFTVRDVEANSFYLSCWWYNGKVELTEGEPMVLEYKVEDATIDGISFKLLKVMHKAMLVDWTTIEEDLHIPSKVTYENEDYIVMSIGKDAFWHLDHATKVTVPKTIRSMDFDYDGAIYANPFRECKSLEWIEVEDGCPLFSSFDGVLFSKDKTMLLGYPIASPRETYTVPQGVTNIRSGAFHHNIYLRKLVIPEGVTNLGWHLFSDTQSLEELYIKGVLDPECMGTLFGGMDTKVAVYVQPSEVEKFLAVYKGPVYPLPEQTSTDMAYRPFVEDDKVWKVGDVTSGNPVQLVDYYFFDDDTIINGKTCKKMMRKRYVSPEHPNYDYLSQEPSLIYVGAWYEEDKKVYEYDTTDKQFKLMYDFSLEDNGTFQINGLSYVIGPKQSGGIKGFKGVHRNVRLSADGESIYSTPWLEGVGGLDCPTTNVYPGYVDPAWFLMTCVVGDEVVYFNEDYEDGATPDAMGARKQRIDFTHIIKTQPKTRMRQQGGDEETLETSPLYGEYNERKLGINLVPLDEAYLVLIADETGKAVYEKTINAGNIVGLNIDISTYVKGHYTVTVENSQESFTGEFEVKTTGIEEVRSDRPEAKGVIYDLQGRRLTSKPDKGVYIQNGKKRVVK